MVNTTFDLIVDLKTEEGEYAVIIEEGKGGMKGFARMFIPVYPKGDVDPINTHDFFLNPEECDALGKHLLAVAERLRRCE